MGAPFRTFLAGAAVTAATLLAAAVHAPPAAAREADPLVAKGRELLDKGDYPGARDAFLAAVAKTPGDAEARRGAAEALLGLGQADEAIAQANAGLEASGNKDGGLWLLAARAYLRKGDTLPPTDAEGISFAYADARAKANMALRQDPALHGARAVAAKVLAWEGDTDGALSLLNEGLLADPTDFDMLFEKGMVCLKRREYPSAVESFSKACMADPASSAAQYQKGIAMAFTRNWELAYEAMAKSSVLDPNNRAPLQKLAAWAKDGSVQWYQKILQERPGHAWAHAYVAYYAAYGNAKDERRALASMKAALAAAPKDTDLAAWNGLVLEGLGKPAEARKAWMKAFEENPGTQLAWDKLSVYATDPSSSASVEERKALIEFLGSRRPGEGVFWNNVGLLHRDMTKDYRASLEAYLKAAALSPEDQGIQNDTGLIYLYHGKSIKEDQRQALPYFLLTLQLVDDGGQTPQMGYRDALENLAVYFMEVEKDPERALSYAERRNDPDFWRSLDASIAAPSPRAAGVKTWAEQQMKR